MLENRKISTAAIGYIIGIILGLYCKINIVLIYVFLVSIYLVVNKNKKEKFKLISLKRYFRYVKLVFNKKVIEIIIIFSILSNLIILFQNGQYEKIYQNLDNKVIKFNGLIVEKLSGKYKVKIIRKNIFDMYIYININNINEFDIGDEIYVEGVYFKPNISTNYKSFNYSNYLKTMKIYGSVNASKIEIISKNNINFFLRYINIIRSIIENKINKFELDENKKALLKGVLLGEKEDISEEIKNDFSISNISYLLAVSGMHISYIIIVSKFIFEKIVGKHYEKILTSIIIFIYMAITNFTPSIVRAGLCGILLLIAKFLYRKEDIYESLSLGVLCILIYNPYLIQNLGMQLSYLGVIGIITFMPTLKMLLDKIIGINEKEAIKRNNKIKKLIIKLLRKKFIQKIIDVGIVTISAELAIIPIILVNYNKISIMSLLISIIASFIIGPIVILGIINLFFKFKLFIILLSFMIEILVKLAKFGSNLPLNQIYFITPDFYVVILYYIFILILNNLIKLNLILDKTPFTQRIKKVIHLLIYIFRENKQKIISIILIFCVLRNVYNNFS